MLGANDERHFGVDSKKQSYYRDGLRNLIGWLAVAKLITGAATTAATVRTTTAVAARAIVE
jgi:hypothetical protein